MFYKRYRTEEMSDGVKLQFVCYPRNLLMLYQPLTKLRGFPESIPVTYGYRTVAHTKI